MESQLFDLVALRDIAEDDDAIVISVLQTFLQSLDDAIQEIRAALNAGELLPATAVAHRLKASARWVGASALAEQCDALEKLKASPDLTAAAVLFDAMCSQHQLLNSEFSRITR